MNYFVGNAGHFLVVFSFFAALASGLSYFLANQQQRPGQENAGRLWFGLHSLSIWSVIAFLFYIIYNHHYEYHYAWEHSSNYLPSYYMISCFWEGQEGSFLLWIFWHSVLGLVLMRTAGKKWEAPVMTVFAVVQAFLCSMILGSVFFEEVKIGSSPFILLRESMSHIPVFQNNPDFVPKDGTGLNPLLQNYWMVIHPPVLFLGFALTLVPFSFAVAGLWQGRYSEWMRPALPWNLVGVGILGLGIMMGAYWAYETLNFGGYWNWDPVENAVYIPWLVQVAGLHMMVSYRKKGGGLKTALILVQLTFVLVLYATFLTRSGILGESSVHSFTDLGLSGQLLVYLLFFALLSVGVLAWRWQRIPTSSGESSIYSPENWVLMGALVLCLASFQVLVATSIPVYNKVAEAFGWEGNMAPPAEPTEFYSQWQLYFAAAIALLSGIGQIFWWRRGKKQRQTLGQEFALVSVPTLVLAALLIALAQIQNPAYILLATAAIFSLIANLRTMVRLARRSTKITGGSIAHGGLALMLLGVLFSSGYSEIVSKNTSGRVFNEDFSEETNRDNVLLWRGKPSRMQNYRLTYEGPRLEAKGYPGYLKYEQVVRTNNEHFVTAADTIRYKGLVYFRPGDTLEIYPENVYYKINYQRPNGENFTLYPRVQNNERMGTIPSPDIKKLAGKDLYTHVSAVPPTKEEMEWRKDGKHQIAPGDTFFISDHVAIFRTVEQVNQVDFLDLREHHVAVSAKVDVMGRDSTYTAEPVFIINTQNGKIGRVPDIIRPMGIRLHLQMVDPQKGQFTFLAERGEKDWIILKAMEKPMINLLWGGVLVILLGVGVATYRRIGDLH